MKKVSRTAAQMEKPEITVGLDLGDRFSHYCMLNSDGDALECGTHSPWISRLLTRLGHQGIVANARKIRAITASESKNDRSDAHYARHRAADRGRLRAHAGPPRRHPTPPSGGRASRPAPAAEPVRR